MSRATNAVIIGAGTYGQVFASYLRESVPGDVRVVGFLDDDDAKAGTTIHDLPVLGSSGILDELAARGIDAAYAPIGNNAVRVRLLNHARRAGLRTPSFIHPDACVSRDVRIGEGVYVLPQTVVMPYTDLEDLVMVSASSMIAHHSVIGMGAFVSSGVTLGAGIRIGERAFIGMGSTIITGVHSIGSGATVGAGAVVLRDVAPDTTVVGNPARELSRRM